MFQMIVIDNIVHISSNTKKDLVWMESWNWCWSFISSTVFFIFSWHEKLIFITSKNVIKKVKYYNSCLKNYYRWWNVVSVLKRKLGRHPNSFTASLTLKFTTNDASSDRRDDKLILEVVSHHSTLVLTLVSLFIIHSGKMRNYFQRTLIVALKLFNVLGNA